MARALRVLSQARSRVAFFANLARAAKMQGLLAVDLPRKGEDPVKVLGLS